MEQMFECLLAVMKADREKILAKMEAKIEAVQEKHDNGQEEVKTRIS
jgi:hypothetical protein